MKPINLTYSLADQSFRKTKSLGILNVSVHLANELSRRAELNRFQVLANDDLGGLLALAPSTIVTYHNRPVRSKVARILWDQFGVYRAAKASGASGLFLPKGFVSFCRKPPVPVAAYVYDVMFDHYRKNYPEFETAFEKHYFWRGFLATLKHARLIVTLSENSRFEILRVAREHGLPAPDVKVAGVGFSKSVSPEKPATAEIVVLTGRVPHKRTDLAVAYMERWQRETSNTRPVHWVGGFPENLAMPEFPCWSRHPRLSEAEFRSLVSRSRVLVYFSEYEGFGMPPVEAAMVSTAPVFSDIPVMREVMGDAGFPFANHAYESFRTALDTALACPAEVVDGWAVGLVLRHNWASVGSRVIEALQRMPKAV